MARALWKGLINFGLVNIPVALQTGVRDRRPRFRLLHRKDLSPISMERVCQKDGHAVAWEDLVKGYEVEPGHFVAVTEDDFKTAAVERSRSIDIMAFVPIDQIDPRYWDTPYNVQPAKGAESTCSLLAQALEKSGRAGIAKYVMRERQHLAAVRAAEGQLIVSTLRFEADIVVMPNVESPRRTSRPQKELGLAVQLIEGMASDWNPASYKDDYVPALMKVIESKAKGAQPRKPGGRAPKATNVVDLVERLRQSLAANRDAASATSTRKRASRRAPARKRRKKKAA